MASTRDTGKRFAGGIAAAMLWLAPSLGWSRRRSARRRLPRAGAAAGTRDRADRCRDLLAQPGDRQRRQHRGRAHLLSRAREAMSRLCANARGRGRRAAGDQGHRLSQQHGPLADRGGAREPGGTAARDAAWHGPPSPPPGAGPEAWPRSGRACPDTVLVPMPAVRPPPSPTRCRAGPSFEAGGAWTPCCAPTHASTIASGKARARAGRDICRPLAGACPRSGAARPASSFWRATESGERVVVKRGREAGAAAPRGGGAGASTIRASSGSRSGMTRPRRPFWSSNGRWQGSRGLLGPHGGTLDAIALGRLLLRLCDAVAFVHARGLLHRDLKPANVVVRPDGSPVLVDFGAALPLERPAPAASELVTDGYAAPEQYVTDGARDRGPTSTASARIGLSSACRRGAGCQRRSRRRGEAMPLAARSRRQRAGAASGGRLGARARGRGTPADGRGLAGSARTAVEQRSGGGARGRAGGGRAQSAQRRLSADGTGRARRADRPGREDRRGCASDRAGPAGGGCGIVLAAC